jgi:hypothetical protein
MQNQAHIVVKDAGNHSGANLSNIAFTVENFYSLYIIISIA